MDSNDIQRNNYENNGMMNYSNEQISNENSTIFQNSSVTKPDHDLSTELSNMASLTNNQRDLEKLFSHANEVKGDLESVINALVGMIGNNRKEDQSKNIDLRNLIKETVISNYKQESNMLNTNRSSELISQNWSHTQQPSSSTNGPTVNVENVLKTIRANKLYYEQNQIKTERFPSSKDKYDCSKAMKETYFRSLLSDPGQLDRQKPVIGGKLDVRRKQKNKYTNFDSKLENYFNDDRRIKRSKSVRSSCEISSDCSQIGMVGTLHETNGNDSIMDPQYHGNAHNSHGNNNSRRILSNQKPGSSSKNNSINNIQVTNNVGSVNQDYYNAASNSNKSSPSAGAGVNSSPGGNNSPSAWRIGGSGYHNNRFNYDPVSSDCGSSSTGGHLMYNSYSTRSSSHHQSHQHNTQYHQYKHRSHFKNTDYNNSTNNHNNLGYNAGMGTILPVATNTTQQPVFIDESSCSSLSNMSTVSSSAYHFQNAPHMINQHQIHQNQPDLMHLNQFGTTPINNPHHLSTGSQLSASESNSGLLEHANGLNDGNGSSNINKSCFGSSCFERQANSISVSDSEGSAEPVRAIPVKKIPKLPSLGTQLPSKQGSYELILVNQPEQHHRARYMTEGSRGAVKDRTGSGYPTVQLIGWSRPATLQVFVATEDGRTKAHNFYQACKVSGKQILSCKERMFDCTGLIEIQLEAKENQIIVLDCIGILKLRNVDVERRAGIQRIKQKSTMARLVFRVNLPHGDGFYTCLQAVSEPILCTQPIGSPEISKMSLYEGSCKGQMEMFIIGKNIVKSSQVLFQDYSEHKGIVWQADAKIDVEYLHQMVTEYTW